MTRKTKWKCSVILALMGVLYAGHAFAQEGKFQATVFLIGIQQPVVIPDFTINGESLYDAVRFTMMSRETASFDGKTIRRITFKR